MDASRNVGTVGNYLSWGRTGISPLVIFLLSIFLMI
jgi:hypothetical protein